MCRPGMQRLATHFSAARVSLQPANGGIWGIGGSFVLLEPRDVEISQMPGLKVRSEAIEHIGWLLHGDRHRWPVPMPDPTSAIMPQILNTLHAMNLSGCGEDSPLPRRDIRYLKFDSSGCKHRHQDEIVCIARPGIYRKCGPDSALLKKTL